jgi:K+-sensing histidine kinase KdpD
VHCATSEPKLNAVEQSDREQAIECWLDSHKIADAWDLAPALVNARVDEGDLERVKRTVPAQDLENAIQWLAANLTTRDLLKSLPRLCAYGGELNQVWTNLIDNAIYAVGGTGRIGIKTRRDGEFFLVEISDNGGGIPPEVRPHIFEPFSLRRAAQAQDSAWLSATGSSSNGIREKSTSARVRMAHNLMCGCRLNRLPTVSLSESSEL